MFVDSLKPTIRESKGFVFYLFFQLKFGDRMLRTVGTFIKSPLNLRQVSVKTRTEAQVKNTSDEREIHNNHLKFHYIILFEYV